MDLIHSIQCIEGLPLKFELTEENIDHLHDVITVASWYLMVINDIMKYYINPALQRIMSRPWENLG